MQNRTQNIAFRKAWNDLQSHSSSFDLDRTRLEIVDICVKPGRASTADSLKHSASKDESRGSPIFPQYK